MQKLVIKDLMNILEYEKVRNTYRQELMSYKKDRRISLGPNITLTFENRRTMKFQIQEIMRAERLVHDETIQEEIEVYNSLFKLGFGFVEVGTITPKRQLGNPKPRIFRLEKDQALINRLGFNNDGSEIISKRIADNQPNGFLGINIGPNKETKNKEEDYYKCLSMLSRYAGYITINISSPNTEGLRNFHAEKEMSKLDEYRKRDRKNCRDNKIGQIEVYIES